MSATLWQAKFGPVNLSVIRSVGHLDRDPETGIAPEHNAAILAGGCPIPRLKRVIQVMCGPGKPHLRGHKRHKGDEAEPDQAAHCVELRVDAYCHRSS